MVLHATMTRVATTTLEIMNCGSCVGKVPVQLCSCILVVSTKGNNLLKMQKK
jgi:hypothetical protein